MGGAVRQVAGEEAASGQGVYRYEVATLALTIRPRHSLPLPPTEATLQLDLRNQRLYGGDGGDSSGDDGPPPALPPTEKTISSSSSSSNPFFVPGGAAASSMGAAGGGRRQLTPAVSATSDGLLISLVGSAPYQSMAGLSLPHPSFDMPRVYGVLGSGFMGAGEMAGVRAGAAALSGNLSYNMVVEEAEEGSAVGALAPLRRRECAEPAGGSMVRARRARGCGGAGWWRVRGHATPGRRVGARPGWRPRRTQAPAALRGGRGRWRGSVHAAGRTHIAAPRAPRITARPHTPQLQAYLDDIFGGGGGAGGSGGTGGGPSVRAEGCGDAGMCGGRRAGTLASARRRVGWASAERARCAPVGGGGGAGL